MKSRGAPEPRLYRIVYNMILYSYSFHFILDYIQRCRILIKSLRHLMGGAGYKVGYMPTQEVPVFLTEHIATCPGTYWCSKEQEICNCSGEITYSPELFDGYVYTVPSAEKTYKVQSKGP